MTTDRPTAAAGATRAEAALSPAPYPGPPPAFLVRAAIKLRGAVIALADAMVPAHLAVFERCTGVMRTTLIGAFAKHGIAELLDEGPRTAAQLAARTGLNEDALHRMLRAMAFERFVVLHDDGGFSHTRYSRALREDSLFRTRAFCEYFASASNLAAWAAFEHTLRTGKNGFTAANGASVWDWFAEHPDEEACFAHAMMGITVQDAPFVATLYPFHELTKVCDVGGGRGTLLSELLVRHPHLRGVLCDAPGVIASATLLLERRGVLDRVERAVGNFFEHVPAGADAYVLKNILHDWDDARSTTILANVRKAMSPGHRLLIVENLVEKNRSVDLGVLSDVQMMVVCDEGRERSASEIFALAERVGFRRARVFGGPTVSVVEAIAV